MVYVDVFLKSSSSSYLNDIQQFLRRQDNYKYLQHRRDMDVATELVIQGAERP